MRDIQLIECSVEDITKSAFQHINLLHSKIDQLRILNDELIKSQVEEALKELKKLEFDILRLQESLNTIEDSTEMPPSEAIQCELTAKVEVYSKMVRKVESLAETHVSLSTLITSMRQHAFDIEAYI